MQSEAGASGAVHGALVGGGLCSTFTCSQGLLLMIPNMYKIAGEMLPCVFHVSARSVAGQALCIYGEHSDIMACRSTGFSFLCSQSVQEAHDIALCAHIASLRASLPFVHFFDGFRTSHETTNIRVIDEESMKQFVPWEAVRRHRARAVNPNHPDLRGTAQSPDIYMQCVEAGNAAYTQVPEIVDKVFEEMAPVFGRRYRLFEYYGAEDAEDVVVCMGSGANVVHETVNYLNARGSKVGVLKVRLFRPWSVKHFLEVLPKTVKRIAVLDRSKDAAAIGEPLYLDVCTSFSTGETELRPMIIGGRYGLGSKDFTPGQAMSVFQNLRAEKPIRSFSVGINDDVTYRSLPQLPEPDTVPAGIYQAIMWGMGSDGTVSVSKTIMKILGDYHNLNVQGYSEYEAKKSNGWSVNYLRYGKEPIDCPYNIRCADYVSCSKSSYLYKFDMFSALKENGIFLLNTSATTLEEMEALLPGKAKRILARKNARLFVVDATALAGKYHLGKYVNTTMGIVYFKLTGCMDVEEVVPIMKKMVEKTYIKKGEHIVRNNWDCIDNSLEAVHQIEYPREAWMNAEVEKPHEIEGAPEFVNKVMLPIVRYEGDNLPVSVFRPGGVMPSGTTRYEKRGIAIMNPEWQIDKCIQCNQCATVCPHACIRPVLLTEEEAAKAPEGFKTLKATGGGALNNMRFRIQVSPLDCTGCQLCVEACGDDALVMKDFEVMKTQEAANWEYAMTVPSKGDLVGRNDVRSVQFHQPMLEFSGACDGCGETPYVKLITQLFGERMNIANATGCSSIWGGTASFNPYTHNARGQGPAWANSLFEDNAEYGLGMSVSVSQRRRVLRENVEALLKEEAVTLPEGLADLLAEWLENYSDGRRCQSVANQVMDVLSGLEGKEVSAKLAAVIRDRDLFPKISQWIIGGDGWAYDIGYGGVDHVLSTGEDVNIVVLDTEMYSNTGGQKSKATPMSAVQQFAAGGKFTHKKEMGLMAMSYRNVYVASVALYADMAQAIRAFNEAESYNGPSIIFCYCPCLMQNVVPAMRATFKEVELAVKSGYWPLYRYDPRLSANGKNAFQLDYKKDLSDDLKNFLANERRFLELNRTRPQVAEELHAELKNHLQERHDDFVRRAMPLAKLAAASATSSGSGSGSSYELTILYGSETNHSKDLALTLMQEAEARQVEVTVNELDEMSMEDLATKKHVVILCSTAGNGEFPKNAKAFFAEASKEHPSDLLKNVEIHVFGLGDSSFANYNAAAKQIHTRLQALGAKSIDLTLANDQDPERYMTAWENWVPVFWEQSGVPEPVYEGVPPSNFAVSVKDASAHVSRRRFLPGDAQLIPLVKKTRMTPADYDRNIMHLVFDLDKTDIRYKVGDALAIYPKNTDALVQRFCAYLAQDAETIVGIASSSESLADKFPKTTTVGKIAAEILDLAGRPSRKLFKTMSYFAEGDEAAQLAALSRGEGELAQRFAAETASVMDVLEHFRCRVDLAHLLEVVPAIKPRLYSIASSQLRDPHLLELCIVVNTWKTASGAEKTGLCTGYLDGLDLSNGPVQVAVSVNGGALFMPEDSSAPLLMAGLGTGIAPFRAFVQEKAVQKHSGKTIGDVVFMMGLRYRAKEFLFGEEFEALEKEGVISHLLPAFSRDQAQKVYIQHKVEENPALVCDVLVEKKGYFFYCGPAGSVPTAIEKAILKAFESVYKKSEQEAMDMLNSIKNEGRYVVEAWS